MQKLFSNTSTLELAQPWWLALLLVLVFVWWMEGRSGRKKQGMMFPGVDRLREKGLAANGVWARLPVWLYRTAMVCAVLALGRPRMVMERPAASAGGIDIMLVIDVSESMQQEDFGGVSRLEGVKKVALRFMRSRSSDRFGLVVFRGKSFTQSPLTLDHRVLGILVRKLSVDVISEKGSAIGSAILVATNRLKASVSKEKVMVLLTDGEHNSGEIGPLTAAEIAATEGVRIYAIGTGQGDEMQGGSPDNTGADTRLRSAFNDQVLQGVARLTGGRYYQALSSHGLKEIFGEIDMLEHSRFEGAVQVEQMELYQWLLFPALVLLFAGLVFGNTRFIRIP